MEDQAKEHRDAEELISSLRKKGVTLWLDHNDLRYRAPRGVLTSIDLAGLRALKPRIMKALHTRPPLRWVEPPLAPRLNSPIVSLTFSQQWALSRWEQGRPRFRTVHTATQLLGALNVDALRASIIELVRRHESLRTRLVFVDGVLSQTIRDMSAWDLHVVDLNSAPGATGARAAQDFVCALIDTPIDPLTDPLFAAYLLKQRHSEHVMVTVMDHLISDDVSMSVLLRDIFSLYAHHSRGEVAPAWDGRIQYPHYAAWLQEATSSWNKLHRAYWYQRLEDSRRLRVFADELCTATSRSRCAAHPVYFDIHLSIRLREFTRRAKTTPPLGILSAYAALLMRWCDTRDIVIPYITSGRTRPELDDTIGLFVYPLFVRVQLSEHDTLLDLLVHVTQEYARAIEHADSGRIAAQEPAPKFRPNPAFNWIPLEFHENYPSSIGVEDTDHEPLRLRPFPVEMAGGNIEVNIDLNREPGLLLTEHKEKIIGSIGYLVECVSPDTMRRFERNLRFFIELLLSAPDTPVASIECVP